MTGRECPQGLPLRGLLEYISGAQSNRSDLGKGHLLPLVLGDKKRRALPVSAHCMAVVLLGQRQAAELPDKFTNYP